MTLARMNKTQTIIRRMRTSIQTLMKMKMMMMMMMKEIYPIDVKVRDDHKWQP
jgi:hypothetical protein